MVEEDIFNVLDARVRPHRRQHLGRRRRLGSGVRLERRGEGLGEDNGRPLAAELGAQGFELVAPEAGDAQGLEAGLELSDVEVARAVPVEAVEESLDAGRHLRGPSSPWKVAHESCQRFGRRFDLLCPPPSRHARGSLGAGTAAFARASNGSKKMKTSHEEHGGNLALVGSRQTLQVHRCFGVTCSAALGGGGGGGSSAAAPGDSGDTGPDDACVQSAPWGFGAKGIIQ